MQLDSREHRELEMGLRRENRKLKAQVLLSEKQVQEQTQGLAKFQETSWHNLTVNWTNIECRRKERAKQWPTSLHGNSQKQRKVTIDCRPLMNLI